MNVLIVEDEIRLLEALSQIMREQKYQVDTADNGNDGLEYALYGEHDVIVLDVMLPGHDGFDIVRRLRAARKQTPVLLLTARDETRDKVAGLDCGADDYMTKPFVPEELLARIRALSRRRGDVEPEEISFADLTLNLSTNDLSCGAKRIRLAFKEFEIMHILISNHRTIIKKETLLSKVWGDESDAEDNNVEAYISFLRKKLKFLGSKVSISTIRKVGYHLEAEE